MKKTKKILAGLMAAASLVVGISGMSASAYTPQKNWNILVTPEAPDNPGQHRTYTCTIDKFGGGYQTYCSSISGASGCDDELELSMILSDETPSGINITTTGYSRVVYTTSSNLSITFTFTGVGNKIVANGTIGYNL
jgi:hypothetical protein